MSGSVSRVALPAGGRRSLWILAFCLGLVTVGTPAWGQAAPAGLTIRTVPSIAGAQFALDGTIFVSDASGVAGISAGVGRHVLEALPVEEHTGIRAEFDRWGDDFFRARRPIEIRSGTELEAGYDVSYPVTFAFEGLEGEKVSPSRVTSLTLRSSLGELADFDGPGPHWLKAARIIRRSIGLESKEVQWSVEEAFVDGSNVVNRTEQRNTFEKEELWTMRLLLYSVRFTSQDAILGSPVGTHVVIEYPDGEVRRVPLNEDGSVEVTSLARGQYLAYVEASGISPSMPISVSRERQEAKLKVISYVDLGLFAFVLLGTAVGLAFIGRPRLRSAVRSKLRLRWSVHPSERLIPWT
jgi:hypothetical protein